MASIPKYVEKLLQRREKLAFELIDVCSKIDDYCEKVGVDMDDSCKNSVLTDVTIYCEPWNARVNTREAILAALDKLEKEKNGKDR